MDANDWDRRYSASGLVWSAGPNRCVVEQVTGLPPGRALDLGAGEGRNAAWLATQGWQVSAVDFSAVGLAKGRRAAAQAGLQVDWVVADAAAYLAVPRAFDLVLLCYLQLPLPELRRLLTAAAAALAPGGTLLYLAHDRSNLEHGHGGPRDPAVLATPGEVAAALPGLAIELAEVVRRPLDDDLGHRGGGGAVALDALVRARRA
ncbi:MAG TPA: class I SAM-dependent methyltransferase [Gammaproteobacteria bacterium]